MHDFVYTYILTWRLPAALAVAALAIIPVRYVYQRMRVGDMKLMSKGAIEQAFFASLCIGAASVIHPVAIIFLVWLWMYFSRRHVMSARAWLVSILAIILCAEWYIAIYYLLPAYL